MRKEAFECMRNSMLKTAADQMPGFRVVLPSESAGIGKWREPSGYYEELETNYNNTIRNYGPTPKMTVNPRTMVETGAIGTPGEDITWGELWKMREAQAYEGAITGAAAGHFSWGKQSDDAKSYLMERGAENWARYKKGKLLRNTPTKVEMPKSITDPAARKWLQDRGALIGSNQKQPNRVWQGAKNIS